MSRIFNYICGGLIVIVILVMFLSGKAAGSNLTKCEKRATPEEVKRCEESSTEIYA